jgi:type I restriction enzyme, S subunit
LEDLAQIKYGKDQKQVACEDGKYPILGTGGEMGRTNEFLYDKPSVLIGRKGTIDKPRFMDTPFWTVDTLFYTEVKSTAIPKWLFYKFQTINWYLYNEASGVPSLSGSTIYKIPISIPSLPEQKRIASFFTVLDKKISELKQKKNLLEQYKKGVMQKIFSQELRFKDDNGKDFPKWEKKKLGEVAEINPRSEKLPQSFIYIDLESVVQGRLNKEERISLEGAPSRAQRLLKKNDILFQMVRPYQKNNYFFVSDKTDYVASTGYAQIRTKNNSLFLYQFLHEETFVNKVIEKCTGTSYPSINSSDLSIINIDIPSIKEQDKIADFLNALDEKINRTENQIQQTELYKKGLLQNMFC